MTMDNNAICLDGPLNGTYADVNSPPHGYVQYDWPTGEVTLIHYTSYHVQGDFDPEPEPERGI